MTLKTTSFFLYALHFKTTRFTELSKLLNSIFETLYYIFVIVIVLFT